MTDGEFADAMIEAARRENLLSPRGHIACGHQKTISRSKLTAIHRSCGQRCATAATQQLGACGIQPCCFKVFRMLARVVLNSR